MCTLLLGLSLLLAASAPKDAVQPATQIEGEWTVVALDGTPKEKIIPGTLRFIFMAEKVEIHGADKRQDQATYTLDLKAKPANIDLNDGGGKILGIIEVSGDTMKLCFARDGKPRPTKFKSDEAKGIAYFTLERVKPKK